MRLRSVPVRYALLGIGVALLLGAFASSDATGAQPPPTIELLPASGPCDATVEVRGSGFEPRKGLTGRLLTYLLEPGTTDVSMDSLSPASPDEDGAFAERVSLWEHGCEAAALDSQAEQPSGRLVIAVASWQPDVWTGEGERIPGIIAVARYAYTSTTPYVPTEVLTISPSSGPCDGVLEVTLAGFGPSTPVPMDIGRPHGDASMGTVATVMTDASGRFRGQIQLGDLGCEAASRDALFDAPTEPKEIRIWAGYEPARRFVPARASYTYTTTEPGGGLVVDKLPAAGAGAGAPGAHRLPLAVPLAFGGAGLLLLLLALSARAKLG